MFVFRGEAMPDCIVSDVTEWELAERPQGLR